HFYFPSAKGPTDFYFLSTFSVNVYGGEESLRMQLLLIGSGELRIPRLADVKQGTDGVSYRTLDVVDNRKQLLSQMLSKQRLLQQRLLQQQTWKQKLLNLTQKQNKHS